MAAMKAKDQVRLRGLRAIKSAILLANTDGTGLDLTDDRETTILQRLMKQRRDSFEIFTAQSREDLAVKEAEEMAVIAEFLPQQLTPEQLMAAIQQIIAEVGVMGAANKALAGKTEGKLISAAVKALLG
jgi:uncharacterized protein